jgi:hypothetical protein
MVAGALKFAKSKFPLAGPRPYSRESLKGGHANVHRRSGDVENSPLPIEYDLPLNILKLNNPLYSQSRVSRGSVGPSSDLMPLAWLTPAGGRPTIDASIDGERAPWHSGGAGALASKSRQFGGSS